MTGLRAEWRIEQGWSDPFIEEWNDLIGRAGSAASVNLTPEWMVPWWRHLGPAERHDLIVRDSGRLAGYASFEKRAEKTLGIACTVLCLAGEPVSDRLGLLVDPSVPGAHDLMVRMIIDAASGVDVIRLSELESGSRDVAAFDLARRRAPERFHGRVCARSPVLYMKETLEETLAGLTRSNRTRLHRARRRQAEAGGFGFSRRQPGPEEIPGLLASLRDLEDRSWKGTRGVGLFSTPQRLAFIHDVCAGFSRRGWLDVALLFRDGRLAAYRLGFRHGGVFLDYNLAHDPELARFSPGRTLLDDVIRDSHAIGLNAVDASRGSLGEPHILADWTPDARWHMRCMIFGPTVQGRALSALERHAKPLARRVMRRREPSNLDPSWR